MDKMEQGDHYEEEGKETEVLDESTTTAKALPIKMIIIVVIVVFFLVAVGGALIKNGKHIKLAEVSSSSEIEIQPFKYTADERALLRSYGYTADDIETNELNGVLSDDLVKSAKSALDERLTEQYKELQNNSKVTGSKEYMELLNDTWLAGPIREVKPGEVKPSIVNIKKENVNYVKLPAHGNQLFIKVILNDGTTGFFVTTPERYQAMSDSGNMIISYTATEWEDETFITNIEEVPLN